MEPHTLTHTRKKHWQENIVSHLLASQLWKKPNKVYVWNYCECFQHKKTIILDLERVNAMRWEPKLFHIFSHHVSFWPSFVELSSHIFIMCALCVFFPLPLERFPRFQSFPLNLLKILIPFFPRIFNAVIP